MAQVLSPETLVYGFSLANDPRISPDGTQVVYTVTRVDRETRRSSSQLWLCGIDGANARQLTRLGQHNGGARWSPDGRSVAFVSDRAGDQQQSIAVLSLEGGEAREITRHRVPLSGLAWSPDGRTIAYTAIFDPENPDELPTPQDAPPRVRVTRRLDYKQDTRGYLGDARAQLWLVDVVTGERRMLTSDPADHFHPTWSPDGRTIAVQVPNRNQICSQLALVSVETGEQTLIGPETGVVALWAWSPDGTRLLLAGDTERTWQLDFFLVLSCGALRRLTHDLACQPLESWSMFVSPSQPVWLDGRRALFTAARGGASGLYELDTETGEVTVIQTWLAEHWGMSVDSARRWVVQTRGSLEAVGEVVAYDLATGATRQLTDQNGAILREAPPAAWERFDVQRGEFTIEAWLLKPRDFDPARRYPVILDVHGGPNGWYGYEFSHVQQMLASHGFLVVFSNPRGSGSYGRRFTQQVIRDWGGEDFRDLMAVVDAVLERPYADSERLGIYGYSYGGYMTAWTIAQTGRFRAAVCGAPVFDLESFYGTSDIGHVWGPQQWGGKPHECREWYTAHSPATFAHRARTPTLILHGEADDRCPIGQGEQMFAILKANGCEVEFVRYPGGHHLFPWTGEPAHIEDFLQRVLDWFQRHLVK